MLILQRDYYKPPVVLCGSTRALELNSVKILADFTLAAELRFVSTNQLNTNHCATACYRHKVAATAYSPASLVEAASSGDTKDLNNNL